MSRRPDELDDQTHASVDKFVAEQLGVDPPTLIDVSYSIEEIRNDIGELSGWRVLWDGDPPEGVHARGRFPARYNDIAAGDFDLSSLQDYKLLDPAQESLDQIDGVDWHHLRELSVLHAPATRFELLEAMFKIHTALAAQSQLIVKGLSGTEAERKHASENFTRASRSISATTNEFVKRWVADAKD